MTQPIPTSADPAIQYLLNWTVTQTQAQADMTKKIDGVEKNVLKKVDGLRSDFDTLQKDTSRGLHIAHARMDQFDRFRNAQGKLNATVNQRLKTLEKSSRSSASATPEDRLPEELAKIRSWVDEARTLEHTVVVGATQGNPKLVRSDIDKLLADFSMSVSVKIDQRGQSGVFALKFLDSQLYSSPKVVAKAFKTFANEASIDSVWAKFDEPTHLRMANGRARRFAFDLKGKLEDSHYFQLVDGFLVFGSVLVGPVSMIPDERHWPKLADLVARALEAEHTPFSFASTPQSQLNRRIISFLLGVAISPGFVDDDDDGEETSSDSETMIVDPAAAL